MALGINGIHAVNQRYSCRKSTSSARVALAGMNRGRVRRKSGFAGFLGFSGYVGVVYALQMAGDNIFGYFGAAES